MTAMMSKRFYLTGFLCLLIFDTLTQISMKYAGGQALPVELSLVWLARVLRSGWIYLALGGYLGSFISWMTLLRHAPVGPSFAASHLEIVSVTLLSIWLFNEPLTSLKALGGLLIMLGVLCLARDSSD
ncbi:MAG: EamA family transporter [Candidatus Adiutrix sp.]|jgi:drug/metabolite transporter (DMT)-like permease|nr:EamA family transporter [Candidatus Adiutrix sp.]